MNEIAEKVWRHYFGNKEKGQDAFGIWICKSDYGNKNSKYGWDVEHVWPESKGGSSEISNLQPISIFANQQKGDNLKGVIKCQVDGFKYSIRYAVENSFLYKSNNGKKVGILILLFEKNRKHWINNGYIFWFEDGEYKVAKLEKIEYGQYYWQNIGYVRRENGKIIPYRNWNS